MRPLLLAAVALLAVGIANIDIEPTRTKYVKVPVTKVIKEPAKVKVVRVTERVDTPSGYMTSEQCDKLGRDTGFRDVVNLYGWPAGDNGSDSYAGQLYYPVSDDRAQVCVVDFWRNRVDSTKLEENVY